MILEFASSNGQELQETTHILPGSKLSVSAEESQLNVVRT